MADDGDTAVAALQSRTVEDNALVPDGDAEGEDTAQGMIDISVPAVSECSTAGAAGSDTENYACLDVATPTRILKENLVYDEDTSYSTLAKGNTVLPTAPACYSDQQPKISRFDACWRSPFQYRVWNDKGAIIGTVNGNFFRHIWASSRTSDVFGDSWELTVSSITGAAVGTTFDGTLSCDNKCSNTRVSFPTQAASTTKTVRGQGYVMPLINKGDTAWITSTWTIGANTPKTARIRTGAFNGRTMRCDDVLGTKISRGCAVQGYTAGINYSSTGAYPQFARHVKAAQNSGLPQKLTRILDNATLNRQNAAATCPDDYPKGKLPRPTGTQCDEYPFRSTYEGGAKFGASAVRTFGFCQTTAPSTATGPNGSSRCMIKDTQNAGAGGALSDFYTRNRVVDHDGFYVSIVG